MSGKVENTTPANKPRVCYLRGSFLNPFESQYLEPLQANFDLTMAYSRSHRFDVSSIQAPLAELGCLDYLNGLLPRRMRGRQLPNVLKYFGYDEVLLGLDRFLPGFDLVHSQEQSFYFSYQVAERKKKYGYRMITVQCLLEPFWYVNRPVVARRAEIVRRETDIFIARSERARLALLSEGVEPERVRVIGHGVDLDRFHPGPPDQKLMQELGIEPGRIVILFAGRLVWPKGIFTLADAAKLVLMDPEMHRLDPLFLLVGRGRERRALQDRIRLLDLERSFKFTGRVPYHRLPEIHRLAHIFVLPSISQRFVVEQFGIVLIESMATGKPVITTCSGAIEEVVADAGVIVPPYDSPPLAEAIIRLAKDEALRQELGARGLERVKKKFTHQMITDEIAAAYCDALKR